MLIRPSEDLIDTATMLFEERGMKDVQILHMAQVVKPIKGKIGWLLLAAGDDGKRDWLEAID